ncbi:vitamin K epoxide reductase family protein [Botrimarina mediterranea]|uniref:Vitamin K epoxide reductase family protein n=1 Tax=Botrimarina mediterranea TaxID=2528022 RepID=A0A518KAQ9_9BACT|nr:vitamin K epoxide reductase family protein [Botrimarina mediterranea]QDV74874.1 Vitamin K epoxide reductase family protein [Botrimarina mediterranea]QDV79517.1 Vitamin K epoxide reductase family protein [Planctomycetes bacterium K2D]
MAWITRLLAAAAVGLSAYLLWASATLQPVVGCNAFSGADCDAVLASPWAKWLGVPVAAGGVVCYALALVGSFLAGGRGALATAGWRLMEFTAPLAIGAGLWFTGVQFVEVGSLCVWCLATHACGLAMAIAMIVWRNKASVDGPRPVALSPIAASPTIAHAAEGPPTLGLPTVLGLLGVIVLAGGQTMFAAPTVSEYTAEINEQFDLGDATLNENVEAIEEPESEATVADEPVAPREVAKPARRKGGSRMFSALNGRLKFDTYEQAVLGSPDAPHIVIEMMDYACPHCREFHEKLTEALQRFDGQIAVVVMPVPNEIACNPYVQKARKQSLGACYAAKLALAVSTLAPDEFESFHEWMLRGDSIPNSTASLIEARNHVDGDKLSRALVDEDGSLAARVKNHVALSAAIAKQGRFGLPAQILGNKVIAGPPDTVDELCETWAEAFGLQTPTDPVPF